MILCVRPYSRLIYDGSPAGPSLLDIAEPDDRIIVCNSFSNAWVMAGWRLGWLVLPQGVRDGVTEIVEVTHSGVAPFIQEAGIAALHDPDTAAVSGPLRGRAPARRRSARRIERHPLRRAAWRVLCVRRRGPNDSLRLAKKLVTNHRVAVAPGVAFGPR